MKLLKLYVHETRFVEMVYMSVTLFDMLSVVDVDNGIVCERRQFAVLEHI